MVLFLDLPAEIRSMIFTLAVTFQEPLVTFRLDPYQRDTYTEAWPPPPLTLVSRQFRNESLPLFFQCNEFVLHTEGFATSKLKWQRRCDGKAAEAKAWLEKVDMIRSINYATAVSAYSCTHSDLDAMPYPMSRKVAGYKFWIPYLHAQDYARKSRQGLLAVSVRRRRHGWTGEYWDVSQEESDRGWMWLTVVKKPTGVEADGQLLAQTLQELVKGKGKFELGPKELMQITWDLLEAYNDHKQRS